MTEYRLHPATLSAAAAVLGQADPEFADPRNLLNALRLSREAKLAANATNGAPVGAVGNPRLLTMTQCAEQLGVCSRTVKTLVATGRLPARKSGRKFVRILSSDLATYIENLPIRPVTAPVADCVAEVSHV